MAPKNTRRNFGKTESNLPKLDLSVIQRGSWEKFLKEDIKTEISEISPIDDFTGKNWQIVLENPILGNPTISASKAREKGLTYSAPLKISAILINKKTHERKTQQVFLGDIPQMTTRGTFIINGVERVVINQIVRSAGVYFSGELDASSGRMLYRAEVRPLRGSWLEFTVDRNNVISARIDRRRKVVATALLRAVGIETDGQLMASFKDVDTDENHKYIASTIEKDPTTTSEDALLEVYRKIRPGEPVLLENAESLFENLFFNPRRYNLGKVGRFKINKRLGLSIPNEKSNWVLTKSDIATTISYLIKLQNGEGRVDDIDHLSNRRLRRVGELVSANAFRIGLLRLERSVKEKMSLISPDDKPLPAALINSRPLIASLNEFFRSNQLSTILDDTNPLSEIDNLRRVSVLGPGGINRERASFSIRDVNSSQYGRIDPVRTPEGPNIGLVTYLALYARVNEYGFIETPYRKVEKVKKGKKIKVKVTDEIIYLAADDEEEYHITYSSIELDGWGYIIDERVPLRHGGSVGEGPIELIDLVDLTSRQVVGVSSSLIPFLSHDEGNRALMGANMQCQATPLITPESPIVGTGMEKFIAEGMGRVVRARHGGKVTYVDSEKIEVKLDKKVDIEEQVENIEIIDGGKKEVYHLTKFKRTANSTCYNQKAKVSIGQKVKKGDLLADGPSVDNGELALGKNLIIAYACFEGYGYEDAILISGRLVKDDVLTSIHIEEYEADVVDTKLGHEELTRDIPNVAETDLANLAEDGIVVVGAEVEQNDILVGKIAPKGETELTSEERLLRAIFGEKAREVRDTSLRVPHGERGIVVDVSILDRDKGDELGPGVLKRVVVKVAQIRKITVGDKIAGRHGNKGVIAKIMPVADMPHLSDGTPVDIIISPLSVLARMNLGQLLETHLGWAMIKKGEKAKIPVFDQITEDDIVNELKEANLPVNGKARLINGKTGEPFEEDTVVGVSYILKLKHMVEDKIHARSTGPYSLVTQQPLGGKAQMGGQRLGEMEVWALEAHRAAYTLQEMLTIKSDDVSGRARAFEAIVKGVDIPEATIPESFKVLVRELNALCLLIEAEGGRYVSDDGHDSDKEKGSENGNEKDTKESAGETHSIKEPLIGFRNLTDFKSLTLKLASSEVIRKWSHGEVIKPETINYRTLKPEKDGLFDERIFGPTKDWECYCGKYKRIRYKGVVCDKCGVEVTQSRVRRERMGHISLASPVVHVWFFKGAPSKISLLLGVPPRAIEQVIYFARYLVLEIDEKEKKVAIKNLEKVRDERAREVKEIYDERKKILAEKLVTEKEKAKAKIKDKERLALVISEVELDQRKRKTALQEEERNTIEKTSELFENLIVIAKGMKPLTVLSEEEFDELGRYNASSFFTAKMGAEGVLSAIEKINLEELAANLRKELEEMKSTHSRFARLAKRLKVVDGMKRAKVSPSWMILKVLPVLPPDLRPMVQLSGGRFATSDLNDLYRRVINRNNRLKHLIELGAPEIILRNEKRMLQESVDSLIDASQRKATRRGRGRQPLRSLSDMLKGKQGRFRQNLLGKRVDYSGRSVIVVGPELKLNQCGIPKDMALEMFKPFVLREMITRGIAPNVKSAKNLLERKPSEIFDILDEITANHPILLNRAPTLHKLSIQSFYPVLVEGSAIRIHPAVCSGFNADFDGDQMAVHVPLSKKAIKESKNLMLPQHNLLRPADGSPITTPASKEMALGVYYLTSINPRLEESEIVFANTTEAIFAYQVGKINLRQKIIVSIDGELIETTVGRVIFNEALPSNFEFVNESVVSGTIKQLFTRAYSSIDREKVVDMIDAIKDLGFWGGTVSGLSYGIFDSKILPEKEEIIKKANKQVEAHEENFEQGLITSEEKRRLSQEVWIETTEDLADKTWAMLDETNPIKIISEARVGRVSRDQIKQLAAIRGLVVDPLGRIVELPIKSNFREGLSVFEYVTSSRGSRKGLTDTALKTADAGYLTRRLVDVAHDLIVRMEDCGTKESFMVKRGLRGKYFALRIVGRYAAENISIKKGKKKELIVAKGEIISKEKAEEIDKANIDEVAVRSPLTCAARYGVCVKCYGLDLSNKEVVEMGTPVGVIAAQSIGEPGTQLTLKTKHSAGVVGVDITQGLPRVEELIEARTPKVMAPMAEISGKARVSDTEEGWKVTIVSTRTKPKEEREYIIPKTIQLAVSDRQLVDAGTSLAEGALDIREILLIKGLRSAQEYLVDEIQKVYESQGIPIHDKHFEVIVRKMSDEVSIITSGDTPLLPGELIDKASFEEENEKTLAAGGELASAQQVILGITKRALFTESWLSAASFQQTTSVLTNAALLGKEDKLYGLKESVIIGRLIPVTPKRASLSRN